MSIPCLKSQAEKNSLGGGGRMVEKGHVFLIIGSSFGTHVDICVIWTNLVTLNHFLMSVSLLPPNGYSRA